MFFNGLNSTAHNLRSQLVPEEANITTESNSDAVQRAKHTVSTHDRTTRIKEVQTVTALTGTADEVGNHVKQLLVFLQTVKTAPEIHNVLNH